MMNEKLDLLIKYIMDLITEIRRSSSPFIGRGYVSHNNNSLQETIDGHNVIKLHPSMDKVFTQNDTHKIRCNKLMIQNMGNTKVMLFSAWTLMPGGNITIGGEDDFSYTEAEMKIEFVPGSLDPNNATEINRVEILKFNTNHPQMAFVPQNGKTIS